MAYEELIAEARKFGRPGWSHSFADCFRMIDRLANALASRPASEGEGWRPIESAPKDGSAILGWGELVPYVYPVGDVNEVMPRGARRAVIYWDGVDEAWCASTHPWHGPFFQPTHWRPLPAPPQGSSHD